jgi:FemAB-related protein (PEP-CTERM system-associated)
MADGSDHMPSAISHMREAPMLVGLRRASLGVHALASTQLAVSQYAGESDEWDAFVRRTAGGTFFHLIGWKEVLERTFAFRSHYLIARRAGQIAGVLPLFELHAPFMPRCLLSLPFAVEAGVCAADADAQEALDAAAVTLSDACAARYVELRDGRSGSAFAVRPERSDRFRRALHADDTANLAATPPKRRYMIRVAQRHGLLARVGGIDPDVFHDLYARTAGRFGTPVFPARFFHTLLKRFPDETALLTVWLGELPVAGAVLVFFGDTVCPYYVGSRREFFHYAINDFLYWEVMRYAARRGARCFDFGRSKRGSGAYEFKRLWGFDPEPLRYRVYVTSGDTPRDRSTNDGSVQWLQRAWRRLPLPVMKVLGPFFVKRYGPYYT